MRGLSASLALSVCLAAPATAAEAEASRRAALELYSLRLIQTGMKLKAYPEEAVRRELEGHATVALDVDEQGRLVNQQLVKSSGHALLDGHAMELLQRAIPQTPVPFSLQNTRFSLLVTVAFVIPPRP